MRALCAFGAAATLACLCGGCGAYELQGAVVLGDISYIALVDESDPRLTGDGVAGVQVMLETDPSSLNREVVGTAVSGPDGSFTIPVDEIGAGFLEYEVAVRARAPGYLSTEQWFRLPPSRKRVLVSLAPGQDPPDRSGREDLMEQYRRFNR